MNSTRHKARMEGFFHQDSESEKRVKNLGRKELVIERKCDPALDYGMSFTDPELCKTSKEKCLREAKEEFLSLVNKYSEQFYNADSISRIINFETKEEDDKLSKELFEYTLKVKEKQSKESQTAYKESEGKLFFELDWGFIKQMAERMASNKKEGKYSLWNWKKPMTPKGIEDLKQASMRHLLEIMEGRYEDDGREFGHIEALSDNMMMLNYQLKNNESTITNNS